MCRFFLKKQITLMDENITLLKIVNSGWKEGFLKGLNEDFPPFFISTTVYQTSWLLMYLDLLILRLNFPGAEKDCLGKKSMGKVCEHQHLLITGHWT